MKTCHIGVNGGGAKTEIILLNDSGREEGRLRVEGSNPSFIGSAEATKILFAGLNRLLEETGHRQPDVATLLLCMAGHPPYWRELARQLSGWGEVRATTDAEPILHLAAPAGPAIIIHAATGSFVCARAPDDQVRFAGGLGWLFGDAGSGFDIGRRAITQALFQLQGWAEKGSVADALRDFTKKESYEANSQYLYAHPERNAMVTRFAEEIFQLAENGCEEARGIIGESMDALAEVAIEVARQTGLPAGDQFTCGCSGRFLFKAPAAEALAASLRRRRLHWTLKTVREDPIEGVRSLLLTMKNLSPEPPSSP